MCHQSQHQFITEVVMTLIRKEESSISTDWQIMMKYKEGRINEWPYSEPSD